MEQMAGGKRPSPYPSHALGRGSRFLRALGRGARLCAGFLRARREISPPAMPAYAPRSAPPRRLTPPSAAYRPDAADPPPLIEATGLAYRLGALNHA